MSWGPRSVPQEPRPQVGLNVGPASAHSHHRVPDDWQRTAPSGEPEPAQSGSPRPLLLTSASPSTMASPPCPPRGGGLLRIPASCNRSPGALGHPSTQRWPRLSPLPAPPPCSCSLRHSAQGREPPSGARSHGTAPCPLFQAWELAATASQTPLWIQENVSTARDHVHLSAGGCHRARARPPDAVSRRCL